MNPFLNKDNFLSYQHNSCYPMTEESKISSVVWLAAVIVLMALTICIFLWLGGYTRKTHVEGSLSPDIRSIKVYALQSDVYMGSKVLEGPHVKQHEALYVSSMPSQFIEPIVLKVFAIEPLKLQQGMRKTPLKINGVKEIKVNTVIFSI